MLETCFGKHIHRCLLKNHAITLYINQEMMDLLMAKDVHSTIPAAVRETLGLEV